MWQNVKTFQGVLIFKSEVKLPGLDTGGEAQTLFAKSRNGSFTNILIFWKPG